LRIRRACALGRNPSRRMASSTRARVFRLTCELEFSTREIVPMPTPAASATSRIVVFSGTASITMGALISFLPCRSFAGDRSSQCSPCGSLTHAKPMVIGCASGRPPVGGFGEKSKKRSCEVISQDSGLTGTFCSGRVWNQFQAFARGGV